MKTKFNRVPEKLYLASFGFGGSLPGVGKSYTKNQWAQSLRAHGYQVELTGSTNKASEGHKTIYSLADWTDMQATRERGEYVRKEGRIFSEKSSFFLIDEAWMLSQKDLKQLKKQFPKCCFLLFGDPNQFPPVEDNKPIRAFDNMAKDQYCEDIPMVRAAIKEGCRRPKIEGSDIDLFFNLTKQYRVKTPGLRSVLENIQNGFEDLNSMLKFMDEHKYNEFDDVDLAICRTWDSGVYKWADYDYKYNYGKPARIFKNLKQGVGGVYVGQNNIGAIKNAIYDMDGESYDSDTQITDLSCFKDERNYQLQGGVTCHSIQGSTFRKGSKIVVDVDNAMVLMDDDYREENRELYEDFQKFMYIACSRVQEDDDILFKCNDLGKFCKIASFCNAMTGFRCKNTINTSSEELCDCDDPVEYLISLMDEYNITVEKPEEVVQEPSASCKIYKSKKSRIQFNLNSVFQDILSPQIRYIIIAYLRGEKLRDCTIYKALGIGSNTFYRHKTEILDYIKKIAEENKEKNMVKTGKIIGEIVDEMEEEEKNRPAATIKFGDFDVLWLDDDENEAWKIFYRIAYNEKMDVEEKFDALRRYLLDYRNIEWVSPL